VPAATLTSKGQITVPKEVREALGLKTGDRVGFRIREDGSVVLLAETLDISELRGCVQARVRGLSVDDMQAAVRKAAVAKSHSKRNQGRK
jgi:AbrB family looped-hinge helix DNA binding protein